MNFLKDWATKLHFLALDVLFCTACGLQKTLQALGTCATVPGLSNARPMTLVSALQAILKQILWSISLRDLYCSLEGILQFFKKMMKIMQKNENFFLFELTATAPSDAYHRSIACPDDTLE